MSIFIHQDGDNDELEVRTDRDLPNGLYFGIMRGHDNEISSVRVDRDAVLCLHAALGEWLYPVHTPGSPNRSLIEQMIERNVREQITAILPLHLAPVAEMRCETHCQTLHDAAGNEVIHDAADPEPHDVGHVEEPVKPYQRPFHMTSKADCKVPGCTSDHMSGIHGRQDSDEASRPCGAPLQPGQPLAQVHEECGFLWVLHKVAGTDGPEHGRLMAKLPRRTRPRNPIPAHPCLDCLHGWVEHTGGICWGALGCECTRERPGTVSALAGCSDCPHLHTEHAALNGGCTRCECTRERPGTAGTP